ncbi:MAG: hypothetical protein AAF533_01780 [Acidobacteriota bacterium]
MRLLLVAVLLWLATASCSSAPAPPPLPEPDAAHGGLSTLIEGSVVFTRQGRVLRVDVGTEGERELGAGDYARWSPDGTRLAVFVRTGEGAGRIELWDAEGQERKPLVEGAWEKHGCALEFHANGREIVFMKPEEDRVWAVNVETGVQRSLELPGQYTGEPGISADGTRLAMRWGHDLYAIDLVQRSHRKYARGCSSGTSPDGSRIMNNVGSHEELQLQPWGGGELVSVWASGCLPDRRWDNHHWSNDDDWIAAQGDSKKESKREAYVVQVSTSRCFRLSTGGGFASYPDLFVATNHERPAGTVARTRPKDPADGGSTKATRTTWPPDETDAVFGWDVATASNQVPGPDGRGLDCRLTPAGRARYGSRHDMQLGRGRFFGTVPSPLVDHVATKEALTVEMTITPDGPQDGVLLSWSGLVLKQSGADLRGLWPGRKDFVTLAPLPGGGASPAHLIVTLDGAEGAVFVNGENVRAIPAGHPFGGFTEAELSIGSLADGRDSWSGRLEKLMLLARRLPDEKVAQRASLVTTAIASRTPAPRVQVRCRISEITEVPTIEQLETYRRALVVQVADVLDVVSGELDDEQVSLLRWSHLDKKQLPESNTWGEGRVELLTLEPVTAHPELESELTFDDTLGFDLDQYLVVGSVAKGK